MYQKAQAVVSGKKTEKNRKKGLTLKDLSRIISEHSREGPERDKELQKSLKKDKKVLDKSLLMR